MRVSRRVFVGGAVALPLATSTPQRFARVSAQPAKQVWRHGLSLFGDVKYPLGIALFYKASLTRLGIDATVRTVDQAQYENRLRGFDFDVVISAWPQSLSPGNEQRGYWGSRAADQAGSRNLAGIRNPAVDALIDRVIFAKTRQELVAATRALDRVLLWNLCRTTMDL